MMFYQHRTLPSARQTQRHRDSALIMRYGGERIRSDYLRHSERWRASDPMFTGQRVVELATAQFAGISRVCKQLKLNAMGNTARREVLQIRPPESSTDFHEVYA